MVHQVEVEGYENFCQKITELEKNGKVIVMFAGSLDDTGKSWCPDCVVAEPVVESVIKVSKEDFYFLVVRVGARNEWKAPDCPFRKDKRTLLKSIPTLLEWGQQKRLEESECAKQDLVEMLLEED